MLDHQKKWIYFLPNTFTCLNMACGYGSIMLTLKGNFLWASLILILGAVFDSVDGRVARLTGTQSNFGEQFDSMSDLISFGFAPSFLFYERFLTEFGRAGIVLSFIFLLCGALRLARFNANINRISSDYFQGLPIPFGAMSLIGYVLLSLKYDSMGTGFWSYISIAYILFYSILMITSIPFPSFKKSDWVKKHKKWTLLTIFLIIAAIVMYEELMVMMLITFYVVASFIYFLLNREKFAGIFDGENGDSKTDDV